MEIISLFFPSFISLRFSLDRDNSKNQSVIQVIIKYGMYVLVNNWLAQVAVTYILNVSDVTADALNSFPFFIKYIVIASVIAIAIPFVEELVKKYFKISVETGVDVAKDGKKSKDN